MKEMFFNEFSGKNLYTHKKWVVVLFYIALFSFVVAATCFNLSVYVIKNEVARNVLNIVSIIFIAIYVIVVAICCFRDKNKAPLMFYLVNILSYGFVFSVFCTVGVSIGIMFLILSVLTIIVLYNVNKNFIKIHIERGKENYYQTMLLKGQNYNIVKTYQLFLRTQKQQTSEMQARFSALKSFYTNMLLHSSILILFLIMTILITSVFKDKSIDIVINYGFVFAATLLSFMFIKKGGSKMTKTQTTVLHIFLFLTTTALAVAICVEFGDLFFAEMFGLFLLFLFITFFVMCQFELKAEQQDTDKFLAKVHRLDKEIFLANEEVLNASLNAIHKTLPIKKQMSISILIWICILAVTITLYLGISTGVWLAVIPYLLIFLIVISLLVVYIAKVSKDSKCFYTSLNLTEKIFGTANLEGTIETVEIVNVSGEFVKQFSVTATKNKPVIYETNHDVIKTELIEILSLICEGKDGQIYFNGINTKQIKEEDKFNKVCLIDSQNLEFKFDDDNNITFYKKYRPEIVKRVKTDVSLAIKKSKIKTIDEISLTRAVLKDADIYIIDADCALDKKEAEAQLNDIIQLLPDKIIFVLRRK